MAIGKEIPSFDSNREMSLRMTPHFRRKLPLSVLSASSSIPPLGDETKDSRRNWNRRFAAGEDIAEVRGLAFKAPVAAKVIPRPKDKEKGVQGYYSIKDKALFIYDDIKGSYERGVLIH